jgi:replicative DNA helicase
MTLSESMGVDVQVHSEAIETGLLGRLMLSGANGSDSHLRRLRPGHFYKLAHREIFAAWLALHRQGRPADPNTIKDYLTNAGRLEKAGGAAYIAKLLNEPATEVGYYVERIIADARLRALAARGNELYRAALSNDPAEQPRIKSIVHRIQQAARFTSVSEDGKRAVHQSFRGWQGHVMDSRRPDEKRFPGTPVHR